MKLFLHPRCRPARRLLATVLATLALPCHAGLQMLGGTGHVLDTASEQPVEGATVAMECFRQLPFKSVKIRDVAVRTDRQGGYSFSLWDVLGCDHAFVRVSKPGHVDASTLHARYGYTTFGEIPKTRYLTRDADVAMLRLVAITPARIGTMFTTDGKPAYAAEYRAFVQAFLQAKGIAKTERETAFVREHYCENLGKLSARLTVQESEAMGKAASIDDWRAYCGR